MALLVHFFPNMYRDSVALMQLSTKIVQLPGIEAASAQMATEANIDLMAQAGLLDERPATRPNDMLLVARGEEAGLQAALDFAEAALSKKATNDDGTVQKAPPKAIVMALQDEAKGANLALISTPGSFAAAEAMKALKLGLDVMIFSDNVPVDEEVAIKRYGHSRNLLVMGPDCGTAIINGVPLAFANVVRKGGIGVVGASGTGLQQVTCLIHQAGEGVSEAIGTGGHDLSEAVGGLTMLTALQQLGTDPATKVIVLISKPPAKAVADKVLAAARVAGKPVVVCFLGATLADVESQGFDGALTLEEAALRAVETLKSGKAKFRSDHGSTAELKARAKRLAASVGPGRKYLRGLYSGGTFCYEALILLQDVLPGLQSNTPTKKTMRMSDLWRSSGHTIMDLGDDDFTRGRAHPMIDPALRLERIGQEAADPGTAVILLDVVLGYGAHENPAGVLAPAIEKARAAAGGKGAPAFVAQICGTDADPQHMDRQAEILRAAGVDVSFSNAEAVALVRAAFENIKG
jgi:succinyl-CoA synthetase alpha subunit